MRLHALSLSVPPFPFSSQDFEFWLASTIALFALTWIDLLGLMVLPTYQRRGLGTLLLRQGLQMADEVGAKTYLEASAKGASLYLRHGFKVVDDILIDMRPYGGSGVESEKCMMREAGGG